MERINGYCYSGGEDRKSYFIYYYKESIKEEVVRRCATISLRHRN